MEPGSIVHSKLFANPVNHAAEMKHALEQRQNLRGLFSLQ